jgi:hypothetical protein
MGLFGLSPNLPHQNIGMTKILAIVFYAHGTPTGWRK